MLDIRCNRPEVLKTLDRCSHVAAKKSTMPLTEHLLLRATDKLFVSATDLVMGIQGSCPVEVRSPGGLCVSAQAFVERVKLLPVDQFSLTSKETQLVIKAIGAHRQYTLDTLPANDFPAIHQPAEGLSELEVKSDVLSGLIKAVQGAICPDATRPNLNAAYLEWDGHKLHLTAASGSAFLATCVATVEQVHHTKALIPARSLTELRNLCEASETVTLLIDSAEMFARAGDLQLALKLAAGDFVAYKQLVAMYVERCEHKAKVVAETLGTVLKGVSVASADGVRFTFSKGKLILEASGNERGESVDEVDLTYDGPDVATGFDFHFALDAVQSVGVSDLTLAISDDPTDCMMILSGDTLETSDYTGILAPMRL